MVKSISIKLKGHGARNFMASLLVDKEGEKAVEKCSGPMLEAVKAEIERRKQ